MKIISPTIRKQFSGICWLFIFTLLSPGLLAQQPASSIWDQMELTGHHYKILGTPVFHKDKKTVPIWIPVTGGVITGGVITWLILKDDGGGPSSNPPVANNDSFSVPCGQTTGTVEVLSNDSGDGITITSATGPAGVSVAVSGGSLTISGIGAASFSVSYTITDTEGRMA
ncbi:MAG: Ig-like domain-containing protein, partial [Saprospiraceae bacterium]